MINTDIIENASSVNKVNAKVELYNGSTLVETCTCNDRLQDFTVERVGQDNKFFGFGVFHRATINLIDLDRNLTITEGNTFKIHLGYGESFVNPYPTFYTNKVTRDETTNIITIVAYDKLCAINEAEVNDLALEAPYTIKDVANACGSILGLEVACGKNLWNNNNYITTVPDEYITKTETGFIFTRNDLTGGRAVHYSIPVKAGETYTFSYDITLTGEGARLIIYETEAYGTVLHQERDLSFITYTFEKDMIAVFSIILNSTVLTLDASKIQIEKSAAKTAYEPYLSAFDTSYPTGANFEGTENCKDVLSQIAEVTQTIYFLNSEDKLIFKRLDRDGLPVLTVTKNDYYNLESEDIRRLSTIVDTNELGNSTSIETRSVTGVTQYVRDNPFWELRDDIQLLLTHACAVIGGISASPFHCIWDGNFSLEVGDKIALVTENDSTITSYVLNDIIRYDSTLEETTQFIHSGGEETASNPVSLGERLKQTYAKVDKQNKQIELVASETAANSSSIASLNIAVDGINLAIESLENATLGDFTDLTKRVVALELSDTEIKASVEETQTSVKEVAADVTELGKEISDAVVAVGVLDGTVTNHTANINALLGTVENHAKDLSTLNGTVTTHTEKIGELTTTTSEISARVGTVETKTEELAAKDTELDGTISEVSAKVTTNTTDISSLKLTTDELSVSVGTLTTKTEELTAKDTELDGSITEVDAKVTTNTTDIGNLKLTTEELSVSVGTLTTKTEELTAKDTELDGSITEVNSKVTTNTEDIAALKVSTDEISASIGSLETKTEELTTKDTEIDGTITELTTKVTTNTEDIAALVIKDGEIEASVASLESTTTELSSSLEDTISSVETNTSNIATLTTTTESITASVESLESTTTELSNKDDELQESITTNATAIGELQVSTEEISASVTALETTTDNLTEEVTTNKENIAALQITADGINATVSSLETNITSQLEGLDESVEILSKEVSTKVTAEDITVAIEEERKNGATHVTTSTGFKFDSEGLTITKSDSAISTNIDEDGLSVYKYNEEVLTADNTGVKAQNLHATTYLIIGNNTYFADFTGSDGRARAGCFWTGK